MSQWCQVVENSACMKAFCESCGACSAGSRLFQVVAIQSTDGVGVVHRHEKLAPESGVELTAPISGASFWSMCQGLRILVISK